jgi:hypothetical protein
MTMRMLRFDELAPRVSAFPWGLYQAEHLAPTRADRERDGFYVGMLKDDLQKQRYAYEVSLLPHGVEWSRASEVIFALLNDFNQTGYDRDPAALVFDFADSLLEESVAGEEMFLELHALPDENKRAKSSRRFRRMGDPDGPGEALPSLGLIPGWSTTRNRLDVSQVSTEAGRLAVVIPRSRIHRHGLRKTNKTKWKQTIRDLRQVDSVKVIGAGLDRLSWKGYAFSEVVATQNLAVAASTAPVGWDARGMFSEAVTSPYMAFRRLRFVRFWVEVVEDAVVFLNEFTSSNSLYGDDAFTFMLSGLPSPQELTEAMRAMRSGSLTVERAHSTYLFPKYAKRRSDSPGGE